VPEGLTGTGTRVGDTLANFTVTDQNGDEVELYQFYGQVVQLVLFAEWCGPCNAEAPAIEAASRDLADDGVIILDVMMEQSHGSTPDLDALGRWVAAYSVTHPLVIGGSSFNPLIQGGYPTLPVLNRDMTIATADNFPFNEGYLEDLASR
jgi:thiol-disulfide isomerase/thioredoxin